MSPVTFNDVPSNLRIPFVAAEFDPSLASQGPALLPYKALLVGQKTTEGSADADTIHRVSSLAEVVALAGRGSMLHRQAIAWFASNRVTELWVGVLDDDGAGAKAAGTITFTDADPSVPGATAGTIALYMGGVRVPVAIEEGDDAEDAASAAAAAITAAADLPVTATAASNVVTVQFRHKGVVGNAYDMRVNYRDGEALPEGIEVAFVQLSAGATNPGLSNLIAALGDAWFHVWAHPYTDSTSLESIEEELSSRFGPMRMIDGVAIAAAQGSHSGLATLGDTRNSPHSVIVAQPGIDPITPAMEFGAEVAGLVAKYGATDPSRPFQTIAMKNALPPEEVDLFSNEERNLLLYDGIATTRVASGVVVLDRMITTYQENSASAPDDAYLDVTTMLTLMYLRYTFRVRMMTRYPRHKLANDGTRFGPGQAVITPKIGKAEAISWFRQMEELGLVEGFDQFKADLIVVRSETDPNRLEFLLSPDLINQLVVTATKIAFRL